MPAPACYPGLLCGRGKHDDQADFYRAARAHRIASVNVSGGVSVRKGDLVHITAAGHWCVDTRQRDIATCGPDAITSAGTPNHVPQFSQLMARIGNRFYLVGKEAVIRVEEDGTLQFRINDMITDDNDGAVQVTMVRQTQ